MLYTAIFVALVVIVLLHKYVTRRAGPNPFARDTREPPRALVRSKQEKNKVLKQGFLPSRVPESLDALVVGSGAGGLGVAVMLARAGKRVLVLEQHDRAGGCCHTFTEKGFEFDIGIHYIGDLSEHKPLRVMLDQLTDGQLQWASLDNPFDLVVLGPAGSRRIYPIYSGWQRFPEELKKFFPEEKEAIDKFYQLVKKCGKGIWILALLKIIPVLLAKLLVYSRLVNWLSPFFTMAARSVTEVVNELTDNKDLRAVFSYIFGTYGKIPKEASFSIHSLVFSHYLGGAWYPKGGASEIAYHMIPIIEKAGGAVLVRAPVQRILVNDAKEAYGVSVLKGQEEVNIYAPIVISNAGIFNTYEKLLPKEIQALPAIQSQLGMVQHGEGYLSIFVGLNGTKEELGLKADNYWIFAETNLDELMEEYMKAEKEEAAKSVPLLFISSPSTKDPTWAERNPGKSTLTVITSACYEWFAEWKDERVKNRAQEYKRLKEAFISSVLDTVVEIFPKTKDKIEYVDAGTPVTNQHYIAAPRGEIYGCDHSLARFTPEASIAIHPQTPIKNLYLTGQDVFVCGFAGALAGALTCGSAILRRNLHLDVLSMARSLRALHHKKDS
ncbi:RETST reductase, partial [Atractosteus spatula]|nr:RETST reductase [Atractosteus spatula]